MTIEEKVFEALESTDLNWTVKKLQLQAPEGFEAPESFGTFRSDNKEWLGTVGKQYVPYQNHKMIEAFCRALDKIGHDGEIRGGHLRGGRKVYIQASIADAKVNIDNVKRHITAINSHDGSSSISFGASNEVVVCSNQFNRLSGQINQRVRHTENSVAQVNELAENLQASLEMESEIIRTFGRMANEPLHRDTVQAITRTVFGVDVSDKIEDLSTRKQNLITEFAGITAKEVESHGRTVWGLFNAVTWYTNHALNKKNPQDSLLVGTAAEINNRAYESLEQMLVTSYN